jgi:hypothetical protein
MSYCEKDRDPSLAFDNRAPPPRQAVWKHREVTKMVQRAWRTGCHGLAAVIAVAWDTQLSPVDVRLLTAAQRAQDDQGSVFFLDRAKTGRAAAGTLSRWSEAILEAYLKTLPAAPIGDALLFRNRSGAPPTPKIHSATIFVKSARWCLGRMMTANWRTCGGPGRSRPSPGRRARQA